MDPKTELLRPGLPFHMSLDLKMKEHRHSAWIMPRRRPEWLQIRHRWTERQRQFIPTQNRPRVPLAAAQSFSISRVHSLGCDV